MDCQAFESLRIPRLADISFPLLSWRSLLRPSASVSSFFGVNAWLESSYEVAEFVLVGRCRQSRLLAGFRWPWPQEQFCDSFNNRGHFKPQMTRLFIGPLSEEKLAVVLHLYATSSSPAQGFLKLRLSSPRVLGRKPVLCSSMIS